MDDLERKFSNLGSRALSVVWVASGGALIEERLGGDVDCPIKNRDSAGLRSTSASLNRSQGVSLDGRYRLWVSFRWVFQRQS
jgi:hypothetical protein